MANEGRVVTLNASSYNTPPYCCSCGAPKQTEIETSRSQKRGNVTTTLKMSFPYCGPCAERARAYKAKLIIAVAVAVAIAILVTLLVLAIPALPLAVGIVLGLLAGVGGSVGAAIGLRPPIPLLPATSRGEAARILGFDGIERTKVHVTHGHWGDELARANNAISQPSSKGDNFLIAPILAGAILAPIGAIGASVAAHPTVHVDNASTDAVDVFIDGKKALSVGPDANKSFDLGYGKHTFGWAKAGGVAASATVDAEVKIGEAHLYNPGKNACYWLVADLYGSASVAGITQGAQPIQDFYRFSKVDTWFGDNPQSISLGKGQSGGTRVALQRSKSCMQLVVKGCSVEGRTALVNCQRAAKVDADFDKCIEVGEAACGGARGVAPAAGKGPVPASASAPKPAPAPPKKK